MFSKFWAFVTNKIVSDNIDSINSGQKFKKMLKSNNYVELSVALLKAVLTAFIFLLIKNDFMQMASINVFFVVPNNSKLQT